MMRGLKFTYFSDVKDGLLQKNISAQIKKDLATFEGKRIELSFQQKRSKRSNRQNALWWLYCTILASDLGYNKDEMHAILGFKFLQREKVDEKTGEVFPYIESTTKLSKGEFADLVTNLIRYAAEMFHVVLPNPSEQTEINLI